MNSVTSVLAQTSSVLLDFLSFNKENNKQEEPIKKKNPTHSSPASMRWWLRSKLTFRAIPLLAFPPTHVCVCVCGSADEGSHPPGLLRPALHSHHGLFFSNHLREEGRKEEEVRELQRRNKQALFGI